MNEQIEDIYDDGYLRVEHKNFYAACNGTIIKLPKTEFLILSRLAKSVNRTVELNELWTYSRGNGKTLNSESLHVFIYRLRTALAPFQLQIDTMVNVGYKLISPPSGIQSRLKVG